MQVMRKRKSPGQIALAKSALNRLQNLNSDLFRAGEPLLSTRLSALVTELQIALENTEEV